MSSIQRSTGSGWSGGGPGTRVSVMVCTIPERKRLLAECVASVKAQLHPTWELLVLEDDEYRGQSVTINRIAAEARGEWLMPFDDDDLMLPSFLAKLVAASGAADVVYAPPLVDGEGPDGFRGQPPNIPTPALIHNELWWRLGGYDEALGHEEDRALFQQALNVGAVFNRVDENLWLYRIGLGHGNKSRGYVPGSRQEVG